MIEIFTDIFLSMNELEFFYYVPCAALVCGIVMLFRGFFGRGVHV